MQGKATLFLLLGALIISLLSVFGGDHLSKLSLLKQSVATQRERNGDLRAKVAELKNEVTGLKYSDRALEKAARNQLGMARSDEIILFFESKR